MAVTGPFRVGDWTAEPDLDRVSRGEERIHLRPQVMRLLVYLSERPGEVAHSEDLMHDLWPGKIVTDATLYNCVSELRNILNGASNGQDAIQTIPKKGYRLRLPVSGIDPPESQTAKKVYSRRRASFVALAALAAAATVWWWPPPSPERSIAVLPFDNMSADSCPAHFADGISEDILNLLSQIESLVVIARQSSFFFKGKDVDIATIGKQLGARNIVQGSVRCSGNRVRITAQLIDAKDSSQLWSEAYDRHFSAESLLEIQREIARAITRRLRVTLTGADEQRLARVPTKNTEAYAAYLLGRKRLEDRTVAELAGAVEQFSLAIKLDPQFADAYAGLADACGLYAQSTGGENEINDFPSDELCPSSLAGREQLARKALELDPESAEAWVSLGTSMWALAIRLHEDQPQPRIHEKLNEALAAFERGLELNPNLSDAYHGYGNNLMFYNVYPDMQFGWIKAWQAHRWESVFDQGLDVDPLSILLHQDKSWYPITVSSKEEAMWHAHRIVEIAPDSPYGYAAVGEQEWTLNGRIDESIPWMSEAMEADPQRSEFPVIIGLAYAELGDPDLALAYFDLAIAVTAPGDKRAQSRLLVEQAVVRLVSGKTDAHQVAEELPPSSQPASSGRTALDSMKLGVFVDLATGRPADAMARFEVYSPECIGAKDIPAKWMNCPADLVRVYQALGDRKTEQALSDAVIRRGQLVAELKVVWWQLMYAGTLATAGRADAALDVLESLVSSGWRGDTYFKHLRFILCCDVVFDAIRDHERFQAIAATIEADMAQQLEHVREMERRSELPTLEGVHALIASARERAHRKSQ